MSGFSCSYWLVPGIYKEGKLAPATIVDPGTNAHRCFSAQCSRPTYSVIVGLKPTSRWSPCLPCGGPDAIKPLHVVALVPEGTPTHTSSRCSHGYAGIIFCRVLWWLCAVKRFLLIAAVAGGLRYDLVRTNALKNGNYRGITVINAHRRLSRQVMWIPGLATVVGTVYCASVSVKFAIKVPQSVPGGCFSMVLITCAAASYFSGWHHRLPGQAGIHTLPDSPS